MRRSQVQIWVMVSPCIGFKIFPPAAAAAFFFLYSINLFNASSSSSYVGHHTLCTVSLPLKVEINPVGPSFQRILKRDKDKHLSVTNQRLINITKQIIISIFINYLQLS